MRQDLPRIDCDEKRGMLWAMKRAFIVGLGYTGEALARRLMSDGVEVFGLRASPGVASDRIPTRVLDLRAATIPELPEAEDAVVYYMVPTLFRALDEKTRPHLGPPSRFLGALERHRPRALVYLSSTSVYGDREGAWVDELTPVNPGSPWGRMRLDLEALFGGWAEARGLPACVVRLPEIYGPGRGPIERLRKGYTLRFPDRWSNRIHVEDLVRVLDELGRRPGPGLLLCSDDLPAQSQVIYDLAASLLGSGPVLRSEEPALDANRLSLLRDSKRCDNQRLRRFLDGPLRYPTFREGLPACL